MNLAMIFIAHDLAVVRRLCDRVAVMYLGRIVEEGATADVFEQPRHPYTQALIRAIPEIDPDKAAAADHARRRAAEPARPAGGLRLSSALSGGHGAVPRRARRRACAWPARSGPLVYSMTR